MTAEPIQSAHAASHVHQWLSARGAWQRRGLAFVAGMAATLGQAPFQLVAAYALAVVVLIWLLDGASGGARRIGSAFALGWWFAFGHFTTGLYWISSAFLVDSDTWGPAWGIPATLTLAAALALFTASGCAVAMALWTKDWRRIAVFALALFASEWVRGHLFGGFPWLLAGYVWTPGEPVSQLASVIGIYGLTLITLLIAAAPATLLDGGLGAARRLAPTLVSALLIGMAFGWGSQRITGAAPTAPGTTPIVRVTDSGLSQRDKWEARADQEWRVLRRYLDATGRPEESDAAIVIWPEGAIPTINFFVLENPDFLDAIGRGLGDRVLVAGLSRRAYSIESVSYFNSAAIIDGVSGRPRVGQVYDKNRLVPFSEIMPFEDVVMSLGIPSLQQMGGFFTPGAPPTRMIIPDAPPAIALVCYEAIFPGMTPRGEDRPGWIISVTNDAWFGAGTGPWQHYAMARYRAIEEGLPLARAASGGVSAIIDPFGREAASTHMQSLAAEAQLPQSLMETLFARYGNLLLAALVIVIAALRFFPAGRPRRDVKT